MKKSDGSLGIEKTPNAQTPFHLQGMVRQLLMGSSSRASNAWQLCTPAQSTWEAVVTGYLATPERVGGADAFADHGCVGARLLP